jgi:hypothetical protein
MKFFVCTPKSQQNIVEPLTHWQQAMTENNGAGILKPGVEFGVSANGVPTVNWLYMDPRTFKQWNVYWKCEEKVVILNPGEYSSFNIPLFTGMVDFEKLFVAGSTQAITKLNTHMFVSRYTDLSQSTTYGALRTKDTTGNAVAVEYHLYTEIAMPDQVGFNPTVAPAIGVKQDLNLRHRAIAFDYYGNQINYTVANALRIDSEQPATGITS